MMHAKRTQHDGKGLQYSKSTAIDCTGSPGRTRQEFKNEADINIMLARFGVNHQQRTLTFGQQDFTIDLQQGLASIEQTKRVYARMSPEIKELYPTYEKFIVGMESGQVALDLEKLDQAAIPARETAEIRGQINRERTREQLLRDDEATRIANEFRTGQPPAKAEGKPKE